MATTSDTLLYLFHHLFLPPKLPQQDDYDARRESFLMSITIDGLTAWRNCTESTHREHIDAAISTMRSMQRAYSAVDGSLIENEVLCLLTQLTEGAALPLYIREQNAGVLITKVADRVLFEVFEISPTDEAIMKTKGRLRRSFPGAAVALEESDFRDRQFQESIAHTLAEMSKHPVEAVQPTVKKSGNLLHEDRDTNHPGMVSELFVGFLNSIGKGVSCPAIAKNMRDDVLWDKARSPWRRSPSWLLIRVALQLGFDRRAPSAAHRVYKEAILCILCHTLILAIKNRLSSEVIFSMTAKLSRRLLKIGTAIDTDVLLHVQKAIGSAHSKVSKRWLAVQKRSFPKIDITELSELRFVQDCDVSIPELDSHIRWMSTRPRKQTGSTFQPSSTLTFFPPDDLPALHLIFADKTNSTAIANLEAFETWVALHCRKWAQDNQLTACRDLESLIVSYHNLALTYYSNNPEALSAMLLTLFELWIACDDVAVHLCPLLLKYDPDVPWSTLQNLLLPFASQMHRLHIVEQYLIKRSLTAVFPSSSLYCDLESSDCFPAQYFGTSEGMQQTYGDIMMDAQNKRKAKLEELRNLKKSYNDLIVLAGQVECEYESVLIDPINEYYDTKHKPKCKRCRYENQAANIEIHIDEWPLPRSLTKAQLLIFEKQIPSYLQSWRQARFYMVKDVIGMQYATNHAPRYSGTLASDPHLPKGPSGSSYIGLLSEDKPHVVTHRRAQKVSTATEKSVCLDNGLNYRYYDYHAEQFIVPFEPTEKVLKMCTYYLPTKSQSLQKYLYRPAASPDGPGSNVALADQSETPVHMGIEEARDLALLPLGHRIQLHNILIQLSAPSLDFKKEETAIFVFQCLYQSGPPNDNALRTSHAILDKKELALRLLDTLTTAWYRIKENWESAQALCILTAITTRLLSLTSSKTVRRRCVDFLETLRIGAFAWVELLRDKSHEAVAQDDRSFFRSKSVEVALICASSFDVEECHLQKILELESEASIFVQCSITIQDGNLKCGNPSDLILTCLDHRFRRLLYRSFPILSNTFSGLSSALQKCWSSYRPGSGWGVVSTHWLVSETTSDNGVRFRVHYNALNGELLVDGVPLSRPPQQYEDHPMWSVLFGKTPVEVIPTSDGAMEFSARRQYKGFDVRVGWGEASSGYSDLLVQASCTDINYETVPSRLLSGKFPHHFVNNFVHWYNYTEETLEFRPRETPWTSSSSTWVLSRSSKGWTLRKETCTLISTESRTAGVIEKLLLPLADKPNIHLVFRCLDGPLLEVELPTLRLGFSLCPGESCLRSREFPGMSIDSDQSLGTLIGFANKLVLRSGSCRLVLLPEGQVSWASNNGHVNVTIEKSSISQVHPLYVDIMLGRLVDNGNLQGKLYLSYLHALTSYCLPDPLTSQTGVEQALSILNSAATRSFNRLSQQNIDTLVLIANLCARRQYYPQNLRVMQTASWVSDLSFLSHHGGFYKVVSEILDQASQMSLFFPGLDRKKLDIHSYINTDSSLISRDIIRTSTFRTSGFGAEEHTTSCDEIYTARDRDQKSARGHNAYVLSSIVYQGRDTLHTDAPQGGKFWRVMLGVSEVLGPSETIHPSELQYSAKATNTGLQLSRWLSLHRALSTQSTTANKFNIMVWLSALAAHERADIALLQVLALIFTTPELEDVELPAIRSCKPSKGYEATSALLRAIIRSHLVGMNSSPESKLRANQGETRRNFENRRNKEFSTNQNHAVNTLTQQLLHFWPTDRLPEIQVSQMISKYVILTKIQSSVRKHFKAWFPNRCLFLYFQSLEGALSDLDQSPLVWRQSELNTSPCSAMRSREHPFVSVRDLFSGPAPILATASLEFELGLSSLRSQKRTLRLPRLLEALRRTGTQSRYEVSYIDELQTSMLSLQGQEGTSDTIVRDAETLEILRQHLDNCKRTVDELFSALLTACADVRNGVSVQGHTPPSKSPMCCPRFSPLLVLEQLSDRAWNFLTPDWRICVTHYGLALTALQRAERLFRAAVLPSDDDLIKELKNIGHRTWDPLEHPEWLLLEVESGILIRDVQERIAHEMIKPRSKCNAVLQLNMGEGKSSVVVPMVAAKLANKSQLARVVVAKPQSRQMAQMLISKLGGLLNRRIYYMPFSRALKLNSTALANSIDEMLKHCQNHGGVLLVQPEHLLSFQLMGIECYCDEGTNTQRIGEMFIRLQDFLDENSRDIVDESDENFSPKFELVYTMGSQKSIELSPARWLCIQQILNLVRSIAVDIMKELPKSIEIDRREQGGFPRLRILKEDAGKLLVMKVARRICHVGLGGFPIARQQAHVREAVFKYISQYNLNAEDISAVETSGDGEFWTESTKPLLFLIRGILAGGVLTFALSRKRWRVDYGLATDRSPPTKLAVPYRAKDNPTPRSKFSHPDVVIVLTTLTYYYSGLENEDLFIALGHLMESDQASIEYDAWVRDSDIPVSFRHLEGINLKDRPQCINDVFPHLKYEKSVIDYFLGHIVFPKEVKEFPYKLSASGWDLGKDKEHYTTGFSGTNDSRKALPLDMRHLDLQSQNHTNALVLEHILQPENSVFLLPGDPPPNVSDAQRFLDMVVTFEKPTRVILDVGAQILELNNEQVGHKWLQMTKDSSIQATVFVNDDDELSVIDRRGRVERLQTSSFVTRLDTCLVFLDQAHTRGIDLKLPRDYRAAVTLGANLTKDRLVQACMRLRNLGKGQSVVFCVTAEIRDKIYRATSMPAGETIGVRDVLHWSISETFADTERSMPLWAAQGARFLRQEELWKSAQADGTTRLSSSMAKRFLDEEAQSIEARYRPRLDKETSFTNLLGPKIRRLGEIEERWKEFDHLDLKSSTLEEEQERELSPEIEQQREVQRPDPAQPATHVLHPDVTNFVDSGNLATTSLAYKPAFDSLNDTSAAGYFTPSQLSSSRLYVTNDFAQTVHASSIGHVSDSFQRPVQWILSSCVKDSNMVDTLMIISPFEAEELMPRFQSKRAKKKRTTLHLYKPRCLTGHQSFDQLDFYTIPRREPTLEVPQALIIQLNLFSGQLYFDSYAQYLDTCEFLGLAADVTKQGEVVDADGYVLRDSEGKSKFDKSPVLFFKVLTSEIRRNGQDISKTHVGSMLDGKLLQQSDFEE
ncbi:hypothetical protein F5Y08DRAFT_112758 [Xylaria arbuscula]|nr:hypothetical protein F5Y08DRAFT_112758 [Xylaria arbuscula]